MQHGKYKHESCTFYGSLHEMFIISKFIKTQCRLVVAKDWGKRTIGSSYNR